MAVNEGLTLSALLYAIGQQESGGNYSADNGIAVGKYQVLKSNVPSWTKEYTGTALTWQQFLADPAAQDQVAGGQLGSYLAKYGAAGAASAWYSGNPNLANSTAPQNGGPSIKTYVDDVLALMAKAPGGSSSGTAATGGPSSTGTTATQAGLLSFPSDIVSFFTSATDDLTASANFFRALFAPSTYVRAGAGIAGLVFLITGLVFLAREAKGA